ncbi:capsular polysaccharide biosynthesis protein CapF [Comamonas testosteroni]|jgi:UDP-2-acetamido-2,6-beta-L-arabino-hexul-4-ose reductase|uniref:NAD-dependent epimerase/dehydratase n=1 Tax=Comamonas testosteroni (strain DSM 14576 / KF-1) TaxID=399795 RepID=B7WT61_COMTK|nr:capsular polysaccharide biosynthesis protein CapF [Comamonas testosteroni]EED65429.1 NAD-dependent epimerase/dehydratase [Comamonas testosteroni KF-1]WQG68838.1 capsular polysaccharide biosynthesis protein CapF [Comamonas testosteroni]
MKKVLITGVNGFVGKNLQLHLAERKDVQVLGFTRESDVAQLPGLLKEVDFVFHLAGVNRPKDPHEFATGNAEMTQILCRAVGAVAEETGRKIPVVCTSSTQAALDNPYGRSKRTAEEALFALQRSAGVPVHVFRLPNVFGKWCKPNYNSAVATFCHNIARDLPIQVNDPAVSLTLVYVDDVVERFMQLMDGADAMVDADGFAAVTPQYTTTVGQLAAQIQAFKDSRGTLMTERVGTGWVRALYATYVSYLPVESFTYTVPQHGDPRGVFVEMLKTPDCGQFSFFTAHPGVTRGGHYHHTKTEKFLVIKGQARFKFRHMQTGQAHELVTSGDKAEIVETVPGWTHDITNIGSDEMIVMLWANEVFNRARPDTFACLL